MTLLAVAGFAAFQIRGRVAPEPSTADFGRATGALAGLGFNLPDEEADPALEVTASPAEPATETDDGDEQSSDATTPVDTIATHGWLSQMQVRALVARYFPEEDVNAAIRVAWCESHFNPTAINPETGGTGLFNHLPEFWDQRAEAAGFAGAEPTDPEANVAAAAYAVYEEGGWAVFGCTP